MKRIRSDRLQAGDIILTARRTKLGKGIRLSTRGLVSHAMIYVQHSSIIDSTSDGVQARNLQRELFELDEQVFAFRLRTPLSAAQLTSIIDFARSQIGTRYSRSEAVKSLIGGSRPRTTQQFCSRLVARAYASVGVQLVDDEDYCTPEELRTSPLLDELGDLTEMVPDAEVAAGRQRPNPVLMMQTSQNIILEAARQLDSTIETFEDLHRLVRQHPEWDSQIAEIYQSSGYLDIWKVDVEANPWHYDAALMEMAGIDAETLREHCVATLREAYSGLNRYAVMLHYYSAANAGEERETTALLVSLYQRLVDNDQLRFDAAVSWLRRHFPEDVGRHVERIVPHSQHWFQIVDRVEPSLGAIARLSIAQAGRVDVCSSCKDHPAHDYWLMNAAAAMPGVPSLRLCDDCVQIRRDMGELLEPFTA